MIRNFLNTRKTKTSQHPQTRSQKERHPTCPFAVRRQTCCSTLHQQSHTSPCMINWKNEPWDFALPFLSPSSSSAGFSEDHYGDLSRWLHVSRAVCTSGCTRWFAAGKTWNGAVSSSVEKQYVLCPTITPVVRLTRNKGHGKPPPRIRGMDEYFPRSSLGTHEP